MLPWQQLAADVGLELDPVTMLPAYREVVVSVMRQSGKTTLTLPVQVDRGVSPWPSKIQPQPQRVVYTAQTGNDARKKLLQDQVPIIEQSVWAQLVAKFRRRAGEEGIDWRNGSMLDLMASGSSAGHGRIVDLGVIDEAFDDVDDRREQALVPAMATRPHAQLWVVSTAGTSQSTYLRRKVETGRHAAEADIGHGVAYLEWSIPDDADVDDPETWWRHMPALGWTIPETAVAHARQTMGDAEWRRAFGNQWTETEHDRIIPEVLWRLVCGPKYKVARDTGSVIFGLDVSPDRASSALGAAGGGKAELLEHRPGTGWVVARCVELRGRYGGRFALDGGGPAASLLPDLEAAGLDVVTLSTQDMAAACGRIYDAIADRTIRVRSDPALDTAVDVLAKRPIGDRFMWSRTASTGDITPLMCLTVAWHALTGDVAIDGALMS